MKYNVGDRVILSSETKIEQLKRRTKSLVIILEIAFIVVLLLLWLFFPSVRESKNLWVLFLYNFPSQFLIAIVPHEPVFLYFSKYYDPFLVTVVALIGTLLTEYVNYSVCEYFMDIKKFNAIRSNKFVKKLIDLFYKAPFMALFIAGLTPIPFYPFRFMVVLAKYPLRKYLLAVALSRSPRFYLLAFFGKAIMLSDTSLLILFIIRSAFISSLPLLLVLHGTTIEASQR